MGAGDLSKSGRDGHAEPWTYYYWDNGSLVSTERFEVLNDRPAPGTDGRYFIGTSGGEAFDADVAAVAIWDRKLTRP